MSNCEFDWCIDTYVDHKEHTWTDGVDGSSLTGRVRRVAVWNSIEDGFDEPIAVSIEGPESDGDAEAWLSVEQATYLRDALSTAIDNAAGHWCASPPPAAASLEEEVGPATLPRG